MPSVKPRFLKTGTFCHSYSVNPVEHSKVEPGKDMTGRGLIRIPEHLLSLVFIFSPPTDVAEPINREEPEQLKLVTLQDRGREKSMSFDVNLPKGTHTLTTHVVTSPLCVCVNGPN